MLLRRKENVSVMSVIGSSTELKIYGNISPLHMD